MGQMLSRADFNAPHMKACRCLFEDVNAAFVEWTPKDDCPVHGGSGATAAPREPEIPVLRQAQDERSLGTAVIADRAGTHGDFRVTATFSQMLHDVMSDMPNWLTMDPLARQALIMIGVKLARIGSGNADAVDHWRDVAGYAQLVVDELARRGGSSPAAPGGLSRPQADAAVQS